MQIRCWNGRRCMPGSAAIQSSKVSVAKQKITRPGLASDNLWGNESCFIF